METFFDPRRLWPPGQTWLHVYLLPESTDTDLTRLISQAQHVLEPFEFLGQMPSRWLHVTLQLIHSGPAVTISARTRQHLTAALAAAAVRVPTFTLTANPPRANRDSVRIDFPDDLPGHLAALRRHTQQAIDTVLGPDATADQDRLAHLSLRYATGSGNTDLVNAALHRFHDQHPTMPVRRIHLLDVAQEPAGYFRWSTIASIELGTGDIHTPEAASPDLPGD